MMREKQRWILVDALGVNSDDFEDCVREAVKDFLGVAGASRANARPEIVKGNFVVKCNHSQLDEVIAALAFKRDFSGKRASLRIKRVSGTLKALLK